MEGSVCQNQPVLRTGFPAISNLDQVLTQCADDFFPPSVDDLFLKFFKSDMYNVVVVEFLGGDFVAEFEPEAM